MKKTAVLISIVFCVTAFLGCQPSQNSKLAGNWICKQTDDRLVLMKDHSGALDSMGMHFPCRWSVSGPNITIESTVKMMGGSRLALTGTFDGRNIVAQDAIMHNKYVFERVSQKK